MTIGKMKKNNINFLYNQFPRDVSIPNPFKKGSFYRKQVTCKRDFQRYLSLMSGSSVGCYTSVYNVGEEILLDKFVFDLDSKDLNEVFAEVDILCSRLHNKNISYAVIFSGRKGAHVYGLLKPVKLERDIAGYYLKKLHESFIDGLKTIDMHLVGNPSAMIRIINSLNNGRYCVPLPFEFRKMSISEILDYSRVQHGINFFPGTLMIIQELVGDLKIQKRDETVFKDEIKVGSVPNIEILEELIRPCVIAEIKKNNPCDIARLDFVSEMMFSGFVPKQILEVIKDLKWEDFDKRQTQYHIKRVFEKRLKPYSNSKLKKVFGCEDKSYYWWSGK